MRQSGVLMHMTSLPSPGGVGTLGKEAYAFADFHGKSGAARVADAAHRADGIRRIALPVRLDARGQPDAHRP